MRRDQGRKRVYASSVVGGRRRGVPCRLAWLGVGPDERRHPLDVSPRQITDSVGPQDGDLEITVHLNQPQPSLPSLPASGYSPMYPCHVPAAQMRTRPVGTGPFKFVEFKQNEGIKIARNRDYWKKGKPYLDGIEFTIV